MHILHMLPLLATGMIALTIVLERISALYYRYPINSNQFFQEIEKQTKQGNLNGALELCKAHNKSSVAQIVEAGLSKAMRDESEIRTALEISILENSNKINKRIGYLAMIANVATLLGLLGTIAGLISSFKAVASADIATKQSLLAEGISLSMNATAFGLLVAIPTMIAFSLLNGKANHLLDDIDKAASKTLSLLQDRIYCDEDSAELNKIHFIDQQKGAA